MRLRWGHVRALLLTVVGIVVSVGGTVLFFWWTSRAAGLAPPQPDIGGIVGVVSVLGIAALVCLAWALTARERLTVIGRTVHYERYIGPFRLESAEYDLPAMTGLRCDVLAPEFPVSGYASPPDPCAEAAAVPDYAVGDSLAVWYKGEPFKFGHTLNPAERSAVARALLEYDAALRARLGLDPAQGLSDVGVWTSTRSLTLTTPVPMFNAGFLGRKSDFDK